MPGNYVISTSLVLVEVEAHIRAACSADWNGAIISAKAQVAEAAALAAVAAPIAVVELRRRTCQQPWRATHQLIRRAAFNKVCTYS